MSSSAVTLGRHSGAALIGQPLDVRVQVMLAPGEDIGTQCIGADVFYGDLPVVSSLVNITPTLTGEGAGSARIVVNQPVNEPIVTLAVRAGCGLPFTRRYVLLADLVSEPATVAATPSPAPAPAPAPRPLPAPAPAVVPPPAVPQSAAPAPSTTPAPVPRVRPPAPPRPPKVAVAPRTRPLPAPAPAPQAAAPAPAPAPAAAAPVAPPAGAPRLRLDPPELSAGTTPNATAPAPEAAAAPAEPNAQEAALAAATAEAQRNAERLAAIETEMARFREAQQRDQARIAELSVQLARAEEQRYSNWLIYLLGGLLLLALLAIAVLARRQRKETVIATDASRAWWADQPDEDGDEPPRMSRRAPLEPSAPVPLDALDVDLDSSPAPLQPTPAQRGVKAAVVPAADRREFQPSAMGVSRSVATEELFDVQQQADFFVSLGEDDQAISVLRNHLAESHEPSPLAYLDLFRLYHRMGRRDDYDALREEFNQVFNAGAPPFERYSDKGRGLEAYESAFARIQALWPQPRVLDLIERSIFRDNEEGETEVFDLEAYRELLMLHAIAKELVERESATQPPVDFQNTSMQPLKAAKAAAAAAAAAGGGALSEDAQRRTVPMDLHVIPPASPRVALDVNIEDLEAESQFEASLPEVDAPVEPTAGRNHAFRDGESMIDFEIIDNLPPVKRRDADRSDDEETPR